MLIELPSLETCHGERGTRLLGALARLQLCEAHGAQTRMQMTAPRVSRARLAIVQARKLCGVAEQTFDLEARFVIPVDRLGGQRDIRAEEQGIPAGGQVAHHHQVAMTLSLGMIDHLRVACAVGITRIELLKMRQMADVDFPVVGFGASRASPAWQQFSF